MTSCHGPQVDTCAIWWVGAFKWSGLILQPGLSDWNYFILKYNSILSRSLGNVYDKRTCWQYVCVCVCMCTHVWDFSY
jgi:hypothetical protein